jgi:hypothetical protein
MLKSRSRSAARRRPARTRLGLEALETRDLMSVSTGIVNGQLLVTGDDTGNFISVSHDAARGVTIIGGDSGTPDSEIPNGVLIQAGANDVVNIFSTALPTTIDGQGKQGNLAVQAGFGNLAGVQGNLTIINAPDLTFLNLDDSLDTTPQNVTLGTVSAREGEIFGPGLPTILYPNFTGRLNFSGGPGDGTVGNTFTVQDTVAAATMSINTGSGNNTIDVEGTTGALTVNGRGGRDSVNVGQDGQLERLQGNLTITNGSGFSTLNVDNSRDVVNHDVTMGVGTDGFGFISGLAQGTIEYKAAETDTVTVNGGIQGNYTITNTLQDNFFRNTSFQASTFLNTGEGQHIVNVQTTTGTLRIDGQNGSARVNVGLNDKVESIHGELVVTNVVLTVNDRADTQQRNVRLDTVSDLAGDASTVSSSITFLAPAPIDYVNVFAVDILGGSGIGGNHYDVFGTAHDSLPFLELPGANTVDISRGVGGAPMGAIEVQFQGSGPNTVNLSANALDQEVLIQSNELGTTTLNVDDSQDTTPRNVTLGRDVTGNNGLISGLGAPIVFQQLVGSVNVNGGPGNVTVANTYTVQDTIAGVTTTINTGTGKNTVNVQGTTGALVINGQGGADEINVGLNTDPAGGGTQLIKGTVSLSDPNGNLDLDVFDAAGPAAPNVTMGVNAQGLGFISGLSQAQILYAPGDVSDVAVRGPQSASTYTITDTANNHFQPDTNLFTGNGKDTVDVLATTGFLVIDTQNSPAAAVNFGNAHSVQGIHGGIEVDSNACTLVVDDSADKIARSVTLFNGSVENLAPAAIFFFDEGNRPSFNVTVDGGSGNNRFDVQTILADVQLHIAVGSGNNTVNVASSGFSLDAIKGPLSFHGAGGSNTVIVNDQAAAAAETYTIQPSSMSRLGLTGASATINFDASVKSLTVNGTNTGFTSGVFTVVDTPKNAVTTLNTGADNSAVHVQGTSGPLFINAVGGNQHVDIGLKNSVGSIKGAVTITNSSGKTGLTVLDTAGPASPNVTMSVDAQGFGFISGLAPAPIKYAQNEVNGVTVNGPQSASTYTITDTPKGSAGILINAFLNGGNTFNVQKTSGGGLEIVDGTGKNTINIGSTANTLDTIQGSVFILGALGGDTLNINDQGSTTPHTYSQHTFQGTTTLSRSGAADIAFKFITNVHLNKGPVQGAPPAAKNLKLTQPIKGSRLVMLSGQLTDANPAAKLTLTVNWDDGSAPQKIRPGQKPFSLVHKYAHKGTYTVHVVWKDVETGLSNSQDLTIKVV